LSRKNTSDDNEDLTRIEDLPPLDHPPLPKLPSDIPHFDIPRLPENNAPELYPESQNVLPPQEIPTEYLSTDQLEDVAMEFEQVHFENQEPLAFPEIEFTSSHAQEIFENTMTSSEEPEVTNVETKTKIKSETKTEKIFEDVKEELETFVLKHVPFESYPSYSLYITQIINGRQRNSIKLLLKEYGLLQSETEIELVARSLQLKHLLIPRISEYAAIFFANKLESLNVNIQFSPSEDLTAHHEMWDQGPITHETYHHHHEAGGIIKPDIFISQNFSFGDKSVKLLGIVLQQSFSLDRSAIKDNFHYYFNQLQDLKNQAREVKANAIVGINFQQIDQDDFEKTLFLVTGEAAIIHEE